MAIGGSVLLKACGLLTRDTEDIDVFWDIDKAKKQGIINDKNIINYWNEGYSDIKVKRYKVKLREFGELDIFQKDNSENFKKIENINWADPIVAMSMKLNYFRKKDLQDFQEIKKKLRLII